jgi:hypothetical protein
VAAIIFTDSTRSFCAALADDPDVVPPAVVPPAVVPPAVVPPAVVPPAVVPPEDGEELELESSRPVISI